MDPTDLALLAPLDALLREGSVTQAAKRLGLSTPAMSHALARIRERFGDPILVRAGRKMVLTPRAEQLRLKVQQVIHEASGVFSDRSVFVPSELSRDFVIHATDHVLTVLGVELDKIVSSAAPQVGLRFVPNTQDDAASLREGNADLAIGIYGDLAPELRTRLLMTDRFVCVVRRDHPDIDASVSLEQFVKIPHIQVAPRGKPGGYVDDVLADKGYKRRVARAVPFFLAAVRLVSQTNYILTISERIASTMANDLALKVLEPPLELQPYALKLVWHPKFDNDPGHQWIREQLLQAAQNATGQPHQAARTKLDPPQSKKKKRKNK